LIIKRGHHHHSLKDFKIFYLGCNIEGNDPSNQEFLRFSRIMKFKSLRRKEDKKLNDNGLNFMLNAIRQFKNADEMKRKMVNNGTPVKGIHSNEIQESPDYDKSDIDYSRYNDI